MSTASVIFEAWYPWHADLAPSGLNNHYSEIKTYSRIRKSSRENIWGFINSNDPYLEELYQLYQLKPHFLFVIHSLLSISCSFLPHFWFATSIKMCSQVGTVGTILVYHGSKATSNNNKRAGGNGNAVQCGIINWASVTAAGIIDAKTIAKSFVVLFIVVNSGSSIFLVKN